MIPGEIQVALGEIELNAGRKTVTLPVTNTGDRPVQVGSHYHFYETNAALAFDREKARGFRLNIAAGTAVRFEPGQTRTVELVALAGDRKVYGFNAAVMGSLAAKKPARTKAAKGRGGKLTTTSRTSRPVSRSQAAGTRRRTPGCSVLELPRERNRARLQRCAWESAGRWVRARRRWWRRCASACATATSSRS